MQEALNDVNGHHALLDEPVKLYRANNEYEPDVIDDGILYRTKGTKRTQIKTILEMTKSYREKYNHFVNKEALKTVRMEMKKNKVVLISGDNYQTNTSVALHLANDYDERRVVIVQNKLDISNIDLDNISLLMVEDIAGKYRYDVARLADWLETFDTLLALVEKGKLNLVATIESDKMEMGMNDLRHHPIFRHEVRVSSDSICVKKEIEMPFASVPTQVPTRQGNSLTPGAQNLNSPVNALDNTDDEINDFSISSVPEFSQNHTTVANQAQASSHHGIPSLESVNVLNVGRLRLNRITILSETCLLVSSNDNMLRSYDRQQDIPTDKVTLKSTVGQLTAIDENQVAGTLPYTGNVVFINVSHTGVLTISKEIYVGEYCGGIAHSDGKLIISNDSGYKVSIMNMDGNIEITFSVKQEISRIASYNIYFSQLVLSPNHDTIYICDPINDTVTALTREGRVLGVVKKLNKLLCPRGMTVDSVGRVYECGLASDTVCLVSPENSNVTRLVGPENGVKRPVDVAFCKWTNSIYVLNLGRNIKVFKINDL